MLGFIKDSRGTTIVSLLIVLQLVLLWLSLGPFSEASIFCTGPSSSDLGLMFGVIHLIYLALLLLALVSLRFSAFRVVYIALLAITLIALPVQAKLVSSGQLTCDAA